MDQQETLQTPIGDVKHIIPEKVDRVLIIIIIIN